MLLSPAFALPDFLASVQALTSHMGRIFRVFERHVSALNVVCGDRFLQEEDQPLSARIMADLHQKKVLLIYKMVL